MSTSIRAHHQCAHRWSTIIPSVAASEGDARPFDYCVACGSSCRRDKSGQISEYTRGLVDIREAARAAAEREREREQGDADEQNGRLAARGRA